MENSGGRTSMALSMDWSFQRQITFNFVIWLLLHPKQRWVCFKGVTLTLAGLTSTSSQIEQGSSLKTSQTRCSCDYIFCQPVVQAYWLHGSVRHRIRLFHALKTAASSSVAGAHNAPSASSSSLKLFCFLLLMVISKFCRLNVPFPGLAGYFALPCCCNPHLCPSYSTGVEQGSKVWIHRQ